MVVGPVHRHPFRDFPRQSDASNEIGDRARWGGFPRWMLGEIMRTSRQIALAIAASLLCMGHTCAAGNRNAPLSIVVQVSPESSSLDLNSDDRTATLRQTSTPVRVTVTGSAVSSPRPIQVYVYACLPTEEAMRLSGKPLTMAAANLRIRNDRGEWIELEPLPELEGRRGVRVAVINGASATILLQVQLQVPAGQAAGNYQGVLTLVAQQQ